MKDSAMTRQDAYRLIDGERDYQDEKWGDMDEISPLTVGEFVLLLGQYAAEAREVWSRERKPNVNTMDVVRKVAGIAVNAMEQHETPARRFFSPDTGLVIPLAVPSYKDRRETRIENVLDSDKDIRTREVWIQYGAGRGPDQRLLVMSYEDAHKLRELLDAMSFSAGQCVRCHRWLDKSHCTTTTCYEPTEEVR